MQVLTGASFPRHGLRACSPERTVEVSGRCNTEQRERWPGHRVHKWAQRTLRRGQVGWPQSVLRTATSGRVLVELGFNMDAARASRGRLPLWLPVGWF